MTLISKKCIVCQKVFVVRTKRRGGRSCIKSMRSIKSLTCCSKCSKIYGAVYKKIMAKLNKGKYGKKK